MSRLDSLLEAIAKRLPSDADENLIIASVRAAAKGLTEKQAKTKLLLVTSEGRIANRIQAKLREAAAAKKAAEAQMLEEEAGEDAEDNEEAEATTDIMSGYRDVDEDDPCACLSRALDLLTSALTSLRPTERATQALDGLLALVGCNAVEASPLPLDALRLCLRLVPAAVAAVGFGVEPLPWRKFLGFLLVAPARLTSSDFQNKDAHELAHQLARLVALSARQPATARSALHTALSALARPFSSNAWLSHVAPGVLLLVQRGFAGSSAFAGTALQRSDMVALLLAYRFFVSCRAAGAVAAIEAAVIEAGNTLRLALERHFDAAPLKPELARLVRMGEGGSKSLRRRLARPVDGRANAAALTLEVMDVLPVSTPVAVFVRLATISGLPVGEDEELDRRIAKARAQGALFFEDVEGAANVADSAFAGVEAVAAAAGAARRKGVESISGIEALRQAGKQSSKKKRKAATEEEDPLKVVSPQARRKAKVPRRA